MELKKYLKQNKIFYMTTIVTVILTFGFTLTHFAIGIDDESIASYSHPLVMQGRWGTEVLGWVFKSALFLPFWRDFIAVLLLILSALVFTISFEKMIGEVLPGYAAVFSSIFVSSPLITYIFVFMGATIETGLCFLFAALALLCYAEYLDGKKKVVLPGILCMTFSSAFYENGLNHFLTGALMLLLLKVTFRPQNQKKRWIELLHNFLQIGIALTVSLAANKGIGYLVLKIIGAEKVAYTSGYMQWNLGANIGEQVSAFLTGIKDNFSYMWQTTSFFKIFAVSVLVFLFAVTAQSIIHKNSVIFILAIAAAGSTLFFYFLTGNARVPYRILTTFSIFTGFSWMYISMTLHGMTRGLPVKYCVWGGYYSNLLCGFHSILSDQGV